MQQAGGQAANFFFKRQGRLMHNNEFQREMARRAMVRPDARQIRSEDGKKGSRKHHQNITVRKEDPYLWYFNKQPFLCTFGFDNAGDVVRELLKAKETKLGRISGLIKGYRKSAYGWSCEKIE